MGPLASVVPGPATNFTTESEFAGQFTHAATVYFRGTVPAGSDYDVRWGFKQGENEIHVMMNADGTYSGKTVSHHPSCGAQGCTHVLNVLRTDHNNVQPPGTARFLWDPNDEGVWMRCADGCCKVSGT